MRSNVWISLIRIFPPEVQEKFMVVMASGNEINISGVIRFETDFMVVRGRLAGTTDEASVVVIPYDQIDYMGFRVAMKDADVEAMFVNSGYQSPAAEMHAAPAQSAPVFVPPPSLVPVTRIMPAQPPTPAPAAAPPPRPAAPEPMAPPPMPVEPAAAPGGSAILPGKAALLERLRRSRLNQEGPKSSEGR